MPKVKSARATAQKWARVTPQRAEDYQEGVNNPKKDWGDETAAANANYKAGIQKAVAEDRFVKGVQKAGTAKWKEGATTKGVQRWGPGVAIAESKYEAGFAPYVAVIENTELPPRYPKGDPRNIARVAAMAKALHDKKMEG